MIVGHKEQVLALSLATFSLCRLLTFLHSETRAKIGQFLSTGVNGIVQIKPSKFSRIHPRLLEPLDIEVVVSLVLSYIVFYALEV